MKITDVLNKLSTARMEYQHSGHSVFRKFVVPYFIDGCDLRKSSHSIALVGSRGSGKSTYIQHFSHSTRFDPERDCVDGSEFECIVLYWKPDTAYCQALKPEWLGEDADLFFKIHASLSLLEEMADMLMNVSKHFPEVLLQIENGSSFFRNVSRVANLEIISLREIKEWIANYKYEISTRLNPLNTVGLVGLDPMEVLKYLIDSLRSDCARFSHSTIKVFVDEFELLTKTQQKIVNTYRKESNNRISWNVAYKANSSPTKETTSDQWLQQPDDYREENLDTYISSDYRIYAAEIFLLTLQNAGLSCADNRISPEFLGERENIRIRRQSEYQKIVLSHVARILPTPTIKELSILCLSKNAVLTKVTEALLSLGIDGRYESDLLSDASLAITFLGTYKQKNFDFSLFTGYLDEDHSASQKIKDKIGSYELNTLLSLNLQLSYIDIPVYAGFERYITMTTPNVRHFKELCFSALKHYNDASKSCEVHSIEEIPSITYESMHLGAVSTSTSLVKEVISYPPHGNKMSQMVNRIGELFKISQKSSYQSEPERDIFSIRYDFSGEDTELEGFIQSALSWRVLVADETRRIKDDIHLSGREFQLNPVYSPYFGISYRKKRGITFTVNEFKCLLVGSYDEYDNLRKKYQKQWKTEGGNEKQGILL